MKRISMPPRTPNAALRTQRDVASAAQVLGLDPQEVQAMLARADSQRPQNNAPVQPQDAQAAAPFFVEWRTPAVRSQGSARRGLRASAAP